jgi:hypothetical protein
MNFGDERVADGTGRPATLAIEYFRSGQSSSNLATTVPREVTLK